MLDEREQQLAEPKDAFDLFVNAEPAPDKHPGNKPPEKISASQTPATDVYRDSSGAIRLTLSE